MDKQAYLIIAHNDFYILKKLLELLDYEKNDIFIHVDAKAKDFDLEYFKNICKKSRIYFTERIKVFWGDYSMIKAELLLMNYATKKSNYKYYHLISGVDLPLKPAEDIYNFFDDYNEDFINFNNTDNSDRIKYYHNTIKKRNSFYMIKHKFFIKIQKLFRINRLKNTKFEVKKGANWFSITDKAARYIISKNDFIEKHFKKSFCADEIFVQTILYNSDLKKNIYNLNGNKDNIKIRYTDWTRGQPYTFDITDYDILMSSNAYFARKFSTVNKKQKQIVDKIYNKIKND